MSIELTTVENAQLKVDFKLLAKRYFNHPELFVKETFKATPTEQQSLVLTSLAKDRKVSVRAGHGVGKSTLASWAIYWFLLTRPYPKIICTAPTFHQLHDVLWAEAASWRQKSKLIQDCFEWQQRRIHAKWSPNNWWAAARTATKGESLTGRHAGHFMLVVDEASGIEDPIYEAAEGMLTSANTYVLMIGNPTKNAGYFYDSHNKDKNAWSTHNLSSRNSPLVDKRYVEDMEARYGFNSNTFRVRVLGEFPYDEEDTLIPFGWVEESKGRDTVISENEALVFGVDVGAGGDKSVILHRRGSKVEKITTHNTKNTMELVGWIAKEAAEFRPAAIFIDPIGVGKGAYDRLAELDFNVFPVDVRTKARKPKFRRLRDELWWATREHFEKGLISLPEDADQLIKELSNIKYKVESDGSIKIESKSEMRRRNLGSPDEADALCMTYYYPDTVWNRELEDLTDPLAKYDEGPSRGESRGWMTA